jgi:hypothetical protein
VLITDIELAGPLCSPHPKGRKPKLAIADFFI